jgi:aspartyl-tRNA(Asn)/glutamyl-tRNA(Gln) amidotransferase subunit A
VAGGIAIAALGSDTGGSIRQPASYCGCVGMKPTYGAVSRFGLTAFSSSLDQIGPITQNVEDASILFDIIKGFDKRDSTSANVKYAKTSDKLDSDKKFTIAVIDGHLDSVSDDVREHTLNIIKELEASGHKIIKKSLLDTSLDLAAYYIVATAEASTNLARFDGIRYGNSVDAKSLKEKYIESRAIGFGDEVKRRILLGTFVLSSGYYDAYYLKAQKAREQISAGYSEIFKDADLVLSPVAPTTAYEFGSKRSGLEMYLDDIFTISVNLAGLPAISVPIAKGANNMPIGVQLIAKQFNEQNLFDCASCVEKLVK